MCALIAIVLLVLGGLFGFSTVSSVQTSSAPLTVEVEPTLEVAIVSTEEAIAIPVVPTVAAAVAAAPTEEAALVPTQVISCAAPSQEQDTADMLSVVGTAFNPATWTRQITSGNSMNSTTWVASSLGALAYLEYLHYDCGVTSTQIDAYYSPEGFRVLLSNYQSYEKTAECRANDLRLYEFDAVANGASYRLRYWVEQTSPTRVAGLMLVFPVTASSKMAAYSERLFPQLPTCESAPG